VYCYIRDSEPGLCILRADGGQEFFESEVEGWLGSGLGGVALLFEFGPCFLDRSEVWRVGWEVDQFGSCGLDPLPDASHFVRAEVAHHDHIAGPERRAEDVVIFPRLSGHTL
jgi:hypothetical protein